MKKIIKAHKGFAHVPESSQGKRRQIGLPQQFRGGRRRAPMPQAPALVKRAPVMQEPKVITQPKPVVRPPKIMDGKGGRDIRGISVGRPPPVFELPNKGRGKNIRRPKPQVRSAQAPRTPMVGKPIARTMQQGGYVSRAKYGIVDNLNKNK